MQSKVKKITSLCHPPKAKLMLTKLKLRRKIRTRPTMVTYNISNAVSHSSL